MKISANNDDDKDKDKKSNLDSSQILNTRNYEWYTDILKSFKTFDNIFFTSKNILLQKINFFINNEEWYKRKGIPYNLGLLFHGDPGCGKTSCIKALANYTGRHVVEINLSKIKTCGEFVKIFNDNYIGKNCIPHNKKIIILEDIDCMIDIVKSRKDNDNEKNSDYQVIDNLETKLLVDESIKTGHNLFKKMFPDNNKLTLSCILNTIDGVLENYGRILIITTNYVEKLDSALIRPGRIDMKINFTRCTTQMYYDIIEFYYDTKLEKNINFTEYNHSPAELFELCSLNTLDKMLKLLTATKE